MVSDFTVVRTTRGESREALAGRRDAAGVPFALGIGEVGPISVTIVNPIGPAPPATSSATTSPSMMGRSLLELMVWAP